MKFRINSFDEGLLFAKELFRLKYSFPIWGFQYNDFGQIGLAVTHKNNGRGIDYVYSLKEFDSILATETTLEELKLM